VAQSGDTFEVRGPIGGWFVWPADRPALGIAGGSGVVPLVAMLRHARDVGRSNLLTLAVSARTLGDLPYLAELREHGASLVITREPAPSGRPAGRLGPGDLQPLLVAGQTTYVCGSAGFAEAASGALLRLEVDPNTVRVERFGPTG
jgi:ferredoxin-NADP reductase